MWHVNPVDLPETGSWSADFWPQIGKDRVLKVLSQYQDQIFCLIHAHVHANQDYMWTDPGTAQSIRCWAEGRPRVTWINFDTNFTISTQLLSDPSLYVPSTKISDDGDFLVEKFIPLLIGRSRK